MAVWTLSGDPQSAAGLPLVLLPGYMADADLWREFAPALQGHAVLHAELKGDSLAAIATRILDECPPRFALLGFSLGGYVAQEIVRLAGDRVAALILVATSARAGTPPSQQAQVPGRFKGLTVASVRTSLGPDRQDDAALVERIQQMGERLGEEAYRELTGLRRASGLPALRQARCPVLVVAAQDDALRTLEESQEMVAATGADFVSIDNSGHMIPMEQPLVLARVVSQWLDRVLAA
jgi:pimeloyl-ACP methyl ester carboxylesterase